MYDTRQDVYSNVHEMTLPVGFVSCELFQVCGGLMKGLGLGKINDD